MNSPVIKKLVILLGILFISSLLFLCLDNNIIDDTLSIRKPFIIQRRRFIINPTPRPELSELISGNEIKQDVSWLLNFVVAAFPKTGTTSLMYFLNTSSSFVLPQEVCKVYNNSNHTAVPVVEKLYTQIPVNNDDNNLIQSRGFKCPNLLYSYVPDNLVQRIGTVHKYFQRTKMIVGVRHPVRWFESMYNYRVEQGWGSVNNLAPLPDPMTLIGSCGNVEQLQYNLEVCTHHAHFGLWLSRLGFTDLSSQDELDLFHLYELSDDDDDVSILSVDEYPLSPWSNEVFLYDVKQFQDLNQTRLHLLQEDVQKFVGIQSIVNKKSSSSSRSGKKSRSINTTTSMMPHSNNNSLRKRWKEFEIDICDERYNTLRSVLMDYSYNSSVWLRNYFLKSDRVKVSSRDYLEEILQQWEIDPCISVY